MTALLSEIRSAASIAPTLESLQQTVVEILSRDLRHYSWAGFYMLDLGDAGTLLLGPFVGDPTPHVRIPVTQGICGAAVASGETVIVDDVSADRDIYRAPPKQNRCGFATALRTSHTGLRPDPIPPLARFRPHGRLTHHGSPNTHSKRLNTSS